MICPKCNEKVALDEKICPKCGAEMEKIYKKRGFFICLFLFIVLCLSALVNYLSENDGTFLYFVVSIVLIVIAVIFCRGIKKPVLEVGRWLLDFATTLDVLSGVLILLAGIPISMNSYGNVPYWWFIVGAFVYSLIMLVKDYVLYLLVDIRDSLKILSDKAKQDITEKQENNE